MTLEFSLLTTPRLSIKPYEVSFENAQKLFDIVERNRAFFAFMYGFAEAKTVEEIYNFIQAKNGKMPSLLACYRSNDGSLVGFVSLSDYDMRNQKIHIGYFIDEAYARCGYMSEAVNAVCADLFRQGWHKIAAMVDVNNIASRKVCEKCGFVREAVLQQEKYNRHTQKFDDIILYARFRD